MKGPSRAPRVAIVGGSITGMACSWELQKHDCTVEIYETHRKLGGHANSVPFEGNGRTVNVDSGFIAMDEASYQAHKLLPDCNGSRSMVYRPGGVRSHVSRQVPHSIHATTRSTRYRIEKT
ncbi:hypothetical protein F4815DRAFT_463093 [Daldinia loculata]|nr:hypothetical protein F4815DRAFT_463093 [Daldinia loculata]